MRHDSSTSSLAAGHRLGRYTIVRPLGRGGMGVVYVARDERLGREVALKLIDGAAHDEGSVERFWREARVAASVSHPNICQVYEVEETPDGVCLAMELLTGEPLDARLSRGPLAPEEAWLIAQQMLDALEAMHARGLIHRDIKPSNVFCTGHGAKVLDFGLARSFALDLGAEAVGVAPAITRTGLIMGTPRYMAPEQLSGDPLDHRSDLWAVGAVLFEMLAGRPPFLGTTALNMLYATLHEHPPALQGPPHVVAIDRVIRRALAKRPHERYPDAATMRRELAAIPVTSGSGGAVPVRALTRVVVPPLRLLRPDPEIGFLSVGLADAVSASLASLGDIVVRAPSVAAGWSDPGADPRTLAAQADVDVVLAGNLLRAGPQLRTTVQLLEAQSGTVVGASTVSGSLDDIFAFEDALTTAALSLLAPLRPVAGAGNDAVRREVPANGRAFELFLRALEQMRSLATAPAARDLLLEAVDADPLFAPAWAALGRCLRVIRKYFDGAAALDREAEDAIRRALALSPDLPMAHRWLTHIEAEQGRADLAVSRLVTHAKVNRNDAQLFAGLVHACRYAGLIEASLAADAEARRLDPTVPTSVEYTLMQTGDAERLFGLLGTSTDGGRQADRLLTLLTVVGADPRLEATYRELMAGDHPPLMVTTLNGAYAAAFNVPGALATVEAALDAHVDPEAHFLHAVGFARLGAVDRAIAIVQRVVAGGFVPLRAMELAPALAPVRAHPAYPALLADAQRRVSMATAIFERARGPELLGL